MAKKPFLPAASWALFDAANSAFPLVMTTAVYVIYFKNVVVGGDDPGHSDFLWGLSLSISAALVALSSPLIGAVADVYNARKRVLLVYTLIAIGATLALSFSAAGMIAFAMVFYILANAGFEGGMVMYGSLLSSVATKENTGKLSGIGWGLGYIGGLVCLLLVMGWATDGQVPTAIRFVALWFAILSIPMFLFVPEPPPSDDATRKPFRALKETLTLVAKNRGLRMFFLAYLIYNDAIITVFSFAAPFATDVLGFSFRDVILLVAGVQVTGAIGAFAFGFLSDKLGHIRTITISLILWIFVTTGAFATALELPIWQDVPAQASSQTGEQMVGATGSVEGNAATASGASVAAATPASDLRRKVFWVLGLLVGFTMGATQSSSRAFLAVVSPDAISGRLFGLYAVAGRFSAVLGPVLFGTISYMTGTKSWGILSLIVFFAVGLALVFRVNEDDVRTSLRKEAVAPFDS